MENKRAVTSPLLILVFVMIGLALIIMTDLFVLGGIQKVIERSKVTSSMGSPDNIASLHHKHSYYMDQGIDIDVSMSRQVMPPPYSDVNEVEISNNDIENITIADVLGQEDQGQYVADIEPASGIVNERYKPLVDNYTDILEVKSEPVDVVNQDITVDPDHGIVQGLNKTPEYIEPKGTGQVVIIIDDMGISLRSKQVEVMPSPLTLSYLPYAKNLDERTKRASANGHEIMLHMPMEAMNSSLDGGPKVLKKSQSNDEFISILEWGLSSFDGFVGFNNHMGSSLTKNRDAMQRMMNHIKGRDLFFIDSKTIGSSVAASVARENGIAYAERDVFIDHEISKDFIRKSLVKLESVAKRQGYAIAIGHPHKETIAVLKEWLPTLKAKGLTLVPASKVVKYPKDKAVNDDVVSVSTN